MAASRASTVLAAALRRSALILAKTCSIGLKPGEYGGRNMRLAPARSIAARAPLNLVGGQVVHDHDIARREGGGENWRARRDSNPWPLPSEGSALSS